MAADVMAGADTPAQKALRKVYAQLVRDLVPGNVYNDLFSKGYLSTVQLEEIRSFASQKKESKANEEVLLAMMKRSDEGIVTFCQLLYEAKLRKCGQLLLNALKAEGVEGVSIISTVPEVPKVTPQYYPELHDMEQHLIHLVKKITEATKDREDLKLICVRLLSSLERIEKQDTKQAVSRMTSPKCSNTNAIVIMQEFIDYLDCRLLHSLVKALGDESLMQEWEAYCEKLRNACSKSLDTCRGRLKDCTTPPNGIRVGLVTTSPPSDFQIQKILEVKQFLCTEVGLEESDFQGFACSDVTLFFAVMRARLPFLLRMFSRRRKALEDIGIAVVFVPGEFIYDVPLDSEHPFSQVHLYQDEGMLQEVQKMFEEMKDGLKTLQEQVSECMHSQTAHFQKREVYQQEKTQLQEQVSKLIGQNLATQDMSATMSRLETLAKKLEELREGLQLEQPLGETIGELSKFKETFAEIADKLADKMDKHTHSFAEEVQTMKELTEKESGHVPHSVEKAEMERLSKEVSTLQKTLIDLPTSSKVFELAEHKWDESVQKTTSVLQEKLAGVVDPRIQVFTTLSKDMEDRHQLFMDQYKQLLEEHHQRFEVELMQLQEFKSTLFAELQRYIESEMKKQKDGLQFEVPAKFQRIIIGQRGQNLKRVESKTGVFNIRIVPGPTEDIALVTMIGDNRRCEAAKKEILIIVAKTQLSREKKIAILTAVQGDFKLCIAEYKGTLPPTYKHEWRFRRFYYLKLCKPAKTQSAKKEEEGHLADQPSEVLDWGKLRNYSIVSSRFQKALEDAIKSGSARLGLEARFGQIFFKAERTLSMDELQANFLVSNVEKDGLIDVSKPLGSTYWTFVTALPKSKFQASDLRLPLVWDFETVDINFTHIPKDPKASYVHFVLHTYRDNKGNFQFMDMRPKLGKDLCFDCLSLHGHLDMRLVLNTGEELGEMNKSALTKLGKAISAGLDVKPGVVLLSDQFLKDVDEEFRVSFVRHEVKKMYLAKDEGHCYFVAHCTVEECDTQQSELADNPSEFPLGEPHQELELKNCQWLADFSHRVGVNWKEEVSSCGCDVSEVHVVPKPVDAVTVVEELRHFAKRALQIAQEWELEEE